MIKSAISAASRKVIYAAVYGGYLSFVFPECGGAASPLHEGKRFPPSPLGCARRRALAHTAQTTRAVYRPTMKPQ